MFDDQIDIESQEEDFDFGKFFRLTLENWLFVLVSLTISVSVAYAYVWYKHPTYRMSATVLVHDQSSGMSTDILEEFGMTNKKRNIENEIAILSSRSQMKKAIESLDLSINYRVNLGYRWRELYKDSPLQLNFTPSSDCPSVFGFDVTVNNETSATCYFKLKGDDEIVTEVTFGKAFSNVFGEFTLNKSDVFPSIMKNGNIATPNYTLIYSSEDNLAGRFMGALNVETTTDRASILKLTITDLVPERGLDILNAMLDEYIQGSIGKKNQLAKNSLAFIETQLENNLEEMNSIENAIQIQKSQSGLTNINAEAEFFLAQVGQLDSKISEIDIQLSFLDYLEKYVDGGKGFNGAAPSSL
ncbi:Wzz/FepE/Etk N-terminal domain-containing protein, partial [Bacteroidota bacterium]